MNKPLTLVVALVAPLTLLPAQGAGMTDPLLISFSANGSENLTEYLSKDYKNANSTWNVLKTKNDNTRFEFGNLQYGNGQSATGVSVTLTTPTTAGPGCVGSFTGDTSILDNYLDTSAVSGSVNASGGVSITFSGLKAGTYTLQVLGARGNAAYTGEVTYGISGEGASVSSASVLASSNTEGVSAPVLHDDMTVSATTHRTGNTDNQADNWALMEYTFTVGDNGTFTVNAAGGGGNIAAMMLVPEPATASLGMLGAFGLLLRRRRR